MRKTILIVDDDWDCLSILDDFLTNLGYCLVLANDARAAFGLLSRGSLEPEIMIVDLAMPGMDGGSFIEALRKHPSLARSRIIVISAFGEAEAPTPRGVLARFLKPLDLAALERYLSQL